MHKNYKCASYLRLSKEDINNDEELYPSNLYLKKEEILKHFPRNEWTILEMLVLFQEQNVRN